MQKPEGSRFWKNYMVSLNTLPRGIIGIFKNSKEDCVARTEREKWFQMRSEMYEMSQII